MKKKTTPNEVKALEVFLRALRESRRKRISQLTIVVDHHRCTDGLDLFFMPNDRGWGARIENGKEEKR